MQLIFFPSVNYALVVVEIQCILIIFLGHKRIAIFAALLGKIRQAAAAVGTCGTKGILLTQDSPLGENAGSVPSSGIGQNEDGLQNDCT